MTSVLVLGGGPDAEREVSLASSSAVHQACLDAGFDATLEVIDQPDLARVQSWSADVIFPVLHGAFGEGGGLQALLAQGGHVFVGCGAQAARLAMDKMGTKLVASRCSMITPSACIFDPRDARNPRQAICPLGFPVIIKPNAEGSSVGLHICHDLDDWYRAVESIGRDLLANPSRVYMIERLVQGREVTVSVLSSQGDMLRALPLIEVAPAGGVYDYDAKYARTDTVYTPKPDIADEVVKVIQDQAIELCIAIGVRHLARVDFMVHDDGHSSVLEVNTMPGFTRTSLMPMAAQADGLSMPKLCAHLVHQALGMVPVRERE